VSEREQNDNYDWRQDSYYLTTHARLRTIAAVLRRSFPVERPRKVLDVGCGAGYLGKILGDDAEYYGCDAFEAGPVPTATPERILHWMYDEKAPSLPFEGERFDAIVCSGFLEYITNREIFFSLARRRISDNGLMLVSFVNYYRPDRRMGLLLRQFGIECPKMYHSLWRYPERYRAVMRHIQKAGWHIAGAISLPFWSVKKGSLRLRVYTGSSLRRWTRYPYRLVSSQLLFICTVPQVEWREPVISIT